MMIALLKGEDSQFVRLVECAGTQGHCHWPLNLSSSFKVDCCV